MRGILLPFPVLLAGISFAQPPGRAQGTVSVDQLQHPLTAEARPEFARSLAFSLRGDWRAALRSLERVSELDPGNPDVRNDLGVLYLWLGEKDKAAQQFREFARLRPRSAAARRNIACAALEAGDWKEAEQAARQSIDLDPDSQRGGYLLALALMGSRRYTDETMKLLRASSAHYPEAHLHLAFLMLHRGALEDARRAIDRYLDSPAATHRTLAAWWQSMLTID
jgi:Tfp pilus assembly protein PilF